MAGPVKTVVRNTGGQIDDMVMSLIDCAYDKDTNVRKVMLASLHDVGKKQPCLVLSSCHSYLLKHVKLAHGHRVVILNAMEAVFKDSIEKVDRQLVIEIIQQVSSEMTQTKEVVPEWQTAASNVLVAMGGQFCTEVMENLIQKFQPGVLPHFFVVQTMAHMAMENVFGMVPFIKVIMGSMLPMLGMCKQENMRWVFSFALSKFCESILDYVANMEKAPDKSVTKEAFSTEVDAAYDVLFNVWLQSKEAKLRLTIVEALGHMSNVMSVEKLQGELPKLIPGILGLYKKHHDAYHITVGLCMILEACTEGGSTVLDPFIENLLNLLFPQVCQPIDYSNALTIKNHNEVLRCFAVLNNNFSDRIISFLLERLNQPQEKIKMASLTILRHLVNTGGNHMDEKKSLVLSGLKMPLNDPNNKVKKILAQVIIAMAHHGYLELEGGQLMLEFIVRQCALAPDLQSKRPTDPEYVSNDALRCMCENVLQLLATTVENMDAVLWPALLEYLVPEHYTGAIGCLCKNMAVIAERKREARDEDYEVEFEKLANIPKPCAIVSRTMVMIGRPRSGHHRGLSVLQCMRAISPIIHENFVDLWDNVLPKLIKYIEDAEEKEDEEWTQKNWEDLVLKMLSKSLDQVEDEDWVVELGKEMSRQLVLYDKFPEEKNFLYKCLGVVMRKSGKNDFVNATLDVIFNTVKHASQLEREGCAIAVGFTAASHIDLVLTKLESFGKLDTSKRSSGLFGFIKDSVGTKGHLEENTKATLMLCYGYVTLFAPRELIASRLEATVMRNLVTQFSSVKDPVLKKNLIISVDLIGKAMHPDHLQSSHVFSYRNDLLNHMENYLKAENPLEIFNDTRSIILDACATLVKLDPILKETEAHNLLKTSLLSVMSLPMESVLARKGKEESYHEVVEHERLVNLTVGSLQTMLHEMVLKDTSAIGLENILEAMSPWMSAVQDIERERSMVLTLSLLHLYLDTVLPLMGNSVLFSTMGSILGRMLPRCTDPSLVVRKLAIDCIQTVLRISMKCQDVVGSESDQMVEALPTLKERLKKTDPNALFGVVKDLAKVLSKKVPSDQMYSLVCAMTEGLSDQHVQSSSGVCVILNGVLKPRGGELLAQVTSLFNAIHGKIKDITNQQTRTGTLRSLRTLAMHHFLPVLNLMLNQPLPFSQETCDCWAVFAQEKEICSQILEHMLDTLSRTVPYEEKTDSSFMGKETTTRVATLLPIACTCAMTEIFRAEEAEEIVLDLYPRLYAAILVRLASTAGTKPPRVTREERDKKTGKETGKTLNKELALNPCTAAVEACKQLLICTQQNEYLESLEAQNTWNMLKEEDQNAEAFTIMARCMADKQPQFVNKVVNYLNPVMSSPYDPQRAMATAFFAELINNKCCGDMTLVEMLVNNLLGKLVDTSLHVRMYCIRGLGNVTSAGSDQVQKFSTTVLSAMMAGMDDKDDMNDEITLEAMNGLSKILAEIDESHIRAILINVALRIRPCFEKDKASVRTSAFTLFGNLARFGDGPSKDNFLEQIHSNLVSILLHLNDIDQDVRKACKTTLKQLGPLLGSETLNNMFQKHLIDSAGLLYGEFMNDLSKIMIEDFGQKINFYVMGCVSFFKSSWPEIRCNAAMFTGFLLGNAPHESYGNISREHVCSALVLLLRDQTPEVRIRAAEAMALMHSL